MLGSETHRNHRSRKKLLEAVPDGESYKGQAPRRKPEVQQKKNRYSKSRQSSGTMHRSSTSLHRKINIRVKAANTHDIISAPTLRTYHTDRNRPGSAKVRVFRANAYVCGAQAGRGALDDRNNLQQPGLAAPPSYGAYRVGTNYRTR